MTQLEFLAPAAVHPAKERDAVESVPTTATAAPGTWLERRLEQRAGLAMLVWCRLAKRGPMTAGELAASFGKRVELIRPRLTDMAGAGEVYDTGERRNGGSRGPREIVWDVTKRKAHHGDTEGTD